ncbi:MAG TPA: hypothetical protein VGI10_06265 [Polyangiaceae bacterium]|jgi:hypothetical protein
MPNPLPADYVRPTLAEFLAASPTHTADRYLPFFERHEAEVRRHAPPASPPARALEPSPELQLEIAEDNPAPAPHFSPRDVLAAQTELAELDAEIVTELGSTLDPRAVESMREYAEHFNPRARLTQPLEPHELDAAPEVPAAVNPREGLASGTQSRTKLKPGYVRPSVAEWQQAGYGRDLTGAELEAVHKKFFDDYEAETQDNSGSADPASGELSPTA